MPTIVSILTFISIIHVNTTSESLKARKVYFFQHFHFLAANYFILWKELRSLPTPGRFFFQKIEIFHFLIFCSTSYYKNSNPK